VVIEEVQQRLAEGDARRAMKLLEAEHARAKKKSDLDMLVRLVPLVREAAAKGDGRDRAAAERLLYAVEQNTSFLRRKLGVPNPAAPETRTDAEPAGVTTSSRVRADGTFTARGRNGQLTVTPTKVIISREGAVGFISQGHKGRKEIDISQISAIQFKDPGPLTVGYIQFSFIGGSETKHGIRDAVRDENSILFSEGVKKDFVLAKELVEEYRQALRNPQPVPPTPARDDLADLERLFELRERGVLTEEEFAAKEAADPRPIAKPP
jgi:hypothetical protein